MYVCLCYLPSRSLSSFLSRFSRFSFLALCVTVPFNPVSPCSVGMSPSRFTSASVCNNYSNYIHTNICLCTYICLCLYVHHHHYTILNIYLCAYCTAIHLCNLHCISLLLLQLYSLINITLRHDIIIILIEFNYRSCTLDFFLCFLGFFVFSDFTTFCFALGVISWSSGL